MSEDIGSFQKSSQQNSCQHWQRQGKLTCVNVIQTPLFTIGHWWNYYKKNKQRVEVSCEVSTESVDSSGWTAEAPFSGVESRTSTCGLLFSRLSHFLR